MNKSFWKSAGAFFCPALLLGVFLASGCGYQLEGTRRSEKLGGSPNDLDSQIRQPDE